jgi:hypothetical protein
MGQRDYYHDALRHALEKDGWTSPMIHICFHMGTPLSKSILGLSG